MIDAQQAASRRPSWYIKTGGLTALALVMVAGVGYWKLHGSGFVGTGSPPMIMAADGPTKVAPPDEKAVQSPSDSGALLSKDSSSYGEVKVVSNQEEPLDVAMKGDSPVAMTKDTPIVPPAANLPIVQPATPNAVDAPHQDGAPAPAASATPNPPPVAAPVAQKKGPKTVTVRTDGTLVADAGPAAQAAAPAATAPAPQPLPATRSVAPLPSVQTQASSPTLDLPQPAKPTKTTARVNVAKTDTTAPIDSVAQPLQAGSVQPDKPQKLPTKLAPPRKGSQRGPGRRRRRRMGGPARRAALRSRCAERDPAVADQIRLRARRQRTRRPQGGGQWRHDLSRARQRAFESGRPGALPEAEGRRRPVFRRAQLALSARDAEGVHQRLPRAGARS